MRPAGTTAVVTGSFPAVAIAVAIVSGAAGMVGVYLDTAWHRTVGRDSFFILPHVFIYCGGPSGLGAPRSDVPRPNPVLPRDIRGPDLPACRLPPPPLFPPPPPVDYPRLARGPEAACRAATFR